MNNERIDAIVQDMENEYQQWIESNPNATTLEQLSKIYSQGRNIEQYDHAHPYGFWDWVESLTHKKADWVIILICLITITIIIILHKLGYV